MSTDAPEHAQAIPAEFRLLVALTRSPENPAVARALRTCRPIDWEAFVALAEFHRVGGLVATNLAAHSSAPVPSHVREHFSRRLRSCSLSALASAKATIEITRSLAQKGVPSVLLKGAAVANRFYASPHARQSIDIDLLVPEHMVMAAQSAIENLGFVQTNPTRAIPAACHGALQTIANELSSIRPSDGVKLELHWRLSRNPHFAQGSFAALRNNATTIVLGGTEIAVLDPPALLTYLVCHGARHAWFRLKWLADIDRMMCQLTSEQTSKAVEQCAHDGTLHLLATSLRLHQELYGPTRVPVIDLSAHLDARLLDAFLRTILDPCPRQEVGLRNLRTVFRSLQLTLSLRHEAAYKASTILGFLTDIRDISTLRLSKRWLWLYPIAGLFLGVGRIAQRELAGRIKKANRSLSDRFRSNA